MNEFTRGTPPALPSRPVAPRRSFFKIFLLVFGLLAVVSVASAAWWYHHNFHASLTPVQLSAAEASAVNAKVALLKGDAAKANATTAAANPSKTLQISEREINGFLKEQGLGDQFSVSIGDGVFGVTALLPVDKDVPVLGGHTLRLNATFKAKLDGQHHLSFILADVNVGGISPPNDWLGGIKGLNLLSDMQDDSFFQGISNGIKDMQIRDGQVVILLND